MSDGSGRLVWAPYLRLAGRGLGMVKCAWLAGRGRRTASTGSVVVLLNHVIQFHSNNATNLHHLTSHMYIYAGLRHNIEIVLRPQITVMSLYPMQIRLNYWHQ